MSKSGAKKTAPIIFGIIAAAAAVIVVMIFMLGKGGGSVITDELREARVGDEVEFGAYEQDNDTANGKEEIEWLVLDEEDGKKYRNGLKAMRNMATAGFGGCARPATLVLVLRVWTLRAPSAAMDLLSTTVSMACAPPCG